MEAYSIESLKEFIEIREKMVLSESITSERKKELSLEISDFKDILLKEYRDISFSPAMTFREYSEYLKTLEHPAIHKTGVAFLDLVLGGGIEEETFVNIIGESGAGKSTFAIQVLLNVAKESRAYFVSLEMGKFKTFNKIEGMIEEENQRDNLYIDIWTRNLDDIVREIELFSYNGVKFFVIDSKMKIDVAGNKDEHLKISELSSTLASLTQRLGIIIILINQISEDSLKTGRTSIKGSGDQKYDTDILISIEKNKKDNNTRILNLVKNRQTEEESRFTYSKDFETQEKEFENANTIIYDGGNGL